MKPGRLMLGDARCGIAVRDARDPEHLVQLTVFENGVEAQVELTLDEAVEVVRDLTLRVQSGGAR